MVWIQSVGKRMSQGVGKRRVWSIVTIVLLRRRGETVHGVHLGIVVVADVGQTTHVLMRNTRW